MGKILLGVLLTLAILSLVGLGAGMLGLLPTRANVPPPNWEKHMAMSAVDASVERHASRVTNPLPPTDQNLIDGMKLYTMNCALCHGSLDQKPSLLQTSFYPPPPNLTHEAFDDPEWQTYYTVRNGIRYTGMPAWDKALTEQDTWKITMLLSHLDKLPPGVQEYSRTAFGVAPSSDEKKEGDEHHDHH